MSRPERPPTEAVPCKACGGPVLWAVWHTGKKMPVDEAPEADGDLVLSIFPGHSHLRVAKYDRDIHQGRRRFVSHMATCPERAASGGGT